MTMRWHHDARWRLISAVVLGTAASVATSFAEPAFAPLLGWATGALAYTAFTWLAVGRFDAAETAAHARSEAPGAFTVHVLLISASLGSLGGIGMLLWQPQGSRIGTAAVTLVVIVASWFTVQTVHALRYARAYFADDDDGVGGIDFHTAKPPQYSDFAYIAFTVGMSFAISDTDLASTKIRRIALSHALLAYLFGTVFLAALVNILASLGG